MAGRFCTVLTVLFALVAHWRVLAQTFQPPAWPLAVKTPYLNTWYNAGPTPAPLNAIWPNLWNPAITGWYCGVFVDGIPYRVLGLSNAPVAAAGNQTAIQVTPTRTSVLMQTGPVNVNMTFLTPITPNDLTRQSLPFSYFYVTVTPTDGQSHSVRVYSDISAEWISGDDGVAANTSSIIQSDVAIVRAQLQTPQPFVENNNRAQDSIGYYAMKNDPGVRYMTGVDVDVRGFGMNSSGLPNSVDQKYQSHALGSPFDVYGLSKDLGNITATSAPVVFVLGVTRDPSIKYTKPTGEVQLRSSYYWSNFSTPQDAISFVTSDFDNVMQGALALDAKIAKDAQQYSIAYGDLISLAARQALSGIEITVSKKVDGSFNSSDVMAFMKGMGGVGTGGVNAVDVLYAAFPVYVYLSPALGGHLLRPLFDAQDNALYTQPYAAQDLGVLFPNATISDIQHNSGIEQSANMLIMTLAHAQASGDGSIIGQHYNLLKGWADYLVANALSPGIQQGSLSDNIKLVNQTNIALKGILGIGAMGKICEYAGDKNNQAKYRSTAESYMQTLLSLAVSSDQRIISSFSIPSSGGMMYNIYADKLLQLGLVPPNVYQIQTQFYNSILATNKLGIPLDSSNTSLSRVDWMMFGAAAAADNSTRNSMIALLHEYAFTSKFNTPLGVLYDPNSGNTLGGMNSPATGALFSILALQQPIQSKISIPGFSSSASSKSKGGVIAGAVIATLAGVALIGAGLFFYLRRRRSQRPASSLYPQFGGGLFSVADRIERVKPSTYVVDPVLEPYGAPSSHDSDGSYGMRESNMHQHVGGAMSYSAPSSDDSLPRSPERRESYIPHDGAVSMPTRPPVHYNVQNPEEEDGLGSSVSRDSRSRGRGPLPPLPGPVAGRSHSDGTISSSQVVAKQGEAHDELRTEVENLRREIELIREQRNSGINMDAPPSYDANALR